MTFYRIHGKTFTVNQLLILFIGIISVWAVFTSVVGPFYESSSKDAVSHKFFAGSASILVLLIASLLFLRTRKKPIDVQPLAAVYQVLLPDEQKIIDSLVKEGGRTTQRKLSRLTGLSRVKTHRVVRRLAEKNIIEVEPAGRTNIITLEKWLKLDE
jgi:uncharacterized membrane protein